MQKITRAVVRRVDHIKQGPWRGGLQDALYYSNGKHVVVTRPDGTFVTVLRNFDYSKPGSWFNSATTIWKK
jgi:hypothetical protein